MSAPDRIVVVGSGAYVIGDTYGPGVVLRAIQAAGDVDFGTLTAIIRRTAFKITRAGELVGRAAAARLKIHIFDAQQTHAPEPHRRLHAHRANEFGTLLHFFIRDPLRRDAMRPLYPKEWSQKPPP